MWGFSIERTQSYLQLAEQKKLWDAPQWIKLGHYEKNLFSTTSPFTSGFFLHPDGHKSPQVELLETVRILFSDSSEQNPDQHFQCSYLARRNWLIKQLEISPEDILECAEMKKWKASLNIKSVALIFAASDLGNVSSSHGHTFLKIINPENQKNKDLIDYAINYAALADANEGFFYAIKGLLGMYPGSFTITPYHQKIREYVNLEGRDIWEYYLNFSEEEVEFLVDHLIELKKAQAPYYFFSDNCSYQVLKTLEVVRPQLKLSEEFKYFVIPIDTVKKITRLPLDQSLITTSKYKKALKTDYLESYRKLNYLQKKALNESIDKFQIAKNYELSDLEKAAVYETAMKYYSILAFRSGKVYENEKYKLYLERVKLKQQNTDILDSKLQPPENSHDSSAFYFGFGKSENTRFISLKFRNALHDLEQPDFGTVAFSHNEMASIEARVSQKLSENNFLNNYDHFKIHRFTYLNLINLNPVSQLEQSFSWKVQASTLAEWKHDIDLNGGYSFDLSLFNRTRIAYFFSIRSVAEKNNNASFDYLNGIGPRIIVASYLNQYIGFSIDAAYYLNDHQESYFKYRTKLNYNLAHNLDMQVQSENYFNQDNDLQAQFVWNFIL